MTKFVVRNQSSTMARAANIVMSAVNPIPETRRKALPGVRLCIHCQEEADKHAKRFELYNRRGSKDSQLK